MSEFIGTINGVTSRNKPNIIYQSMIDGELFYEFAIHRFNKKKTAATFRCCGCRSARSSGRSTESKVPYIKGEIDFESKIVRFKQNPDLIEHCCERRHPNFVKAKQIRREVRNEIAGSGINGRECLQKLKDKVKEREEDGDHDGVMSKMAKTDTLRRRLKVAAAKPILGQSLPVDIDKELQKSKDNQPDPKLQPMTTNPPPILPSTNPRIQQQHPTGFEQFVHPFFGVQQFDFHGMMQMLHHPFRPQYSQHPRINFQQPRVNLNYSFPIFHQLFQQRQPPNL